MELVFLPVGWVTASLEAAAEFGVEGEVVFVASVRNLLEGAWERSRTSPVWGGCLPGEAWEAGL